MSYSPIIVLFILFALNVPVAYGLLVSALFYFTFINTTFPNDLILQRMVATGESFTLLAVPFFVAAGSVMYRAGIAEKLLGMADALAGHMKGGLAQVNVVLSMLMAGASGSANADAAMQSKIFVPEMTKRGYSAGFSCGVTATSATISPIIPPGIGLILYAFMANVSVGRMFFAGFLPGFIIMISLMVAVFIISHRRNYPRSRDKMVSIRVILRQLKESVWALFLPLGILLGLRMGIFTPTEGGAIAVFYALFVGFFVYRKLRISMLPGILLESVIGTGTVMFIISAASTFAFYMSWERIPHTASVWLLGLTEHPMLLLLLVNLFLLFIGMFLEGTAALIILTPLLVPTAVALGIDPIHFGIIMCVNLVIGGVTPPVGTLMFITCSMARISVGEFLRESWVLIIALIVALFIITYIPALSLWLPNLVF